jgi:hypothetical protein
VRVCSVRVSKKHHVCCCYVLCVYTRTEYVIQESESLQKKKRTMELLKQRTERKLLVSDADPLSRLPVELLLLVASHLDIFSVGRLSTVSPTLHLRMGAVYARLPSLHLHNARFRHWDDSRIIGMIEQFKNLTKLRCVSVCVCYLFHCVIYTRETHIIYTTHTPQQPAQTSLPFF